MNNTPPEELLHRLMVRDGKVKRDVEAKFFNVHKESRGWYIVIPSDGEHYLHHDGLVKLGVNSDSDKPAFWPTEQDAQEFFDSWKATQAFK